jgi:hypothetical protein
VGVWDLLQGLVQNGDVIGGRVAAGAAFAQHAGQRLPGAVQETEQWVVAERPFVGRGRGLFLCVADHDRGV